MDGPDEMHEDALAAAVAAQGLERAMQHFPDDVRNAATRSRTLRAGIPRDLGLADEAAHVYRPHLRRPGPEGGR